MKTEPFTTQEFHARLRAQLGFTQAETDKPDSIQAETGDTVEQHGAAESFSNWLDEKEQAERDALADWYDGGREELKRIEGE